MGEKDNVNLLNLPKENDWILSGLAFDTTFVRFLHGQILKVKKKSKKN